MRVQDMDAAIAWERAVLGFDLIDGPCPVHLREPGCKATGRRWLL